MRRMAPATRVALVKKIDAKTSPLLHAETEIQFLLPFELFFLLVSKCRKAQPFDVFPR